MGQVCPVSPKSFSTGSSEMTSIHLVTVPIQLQDLCPKDLFSGLIWFHNDLPSIDNWSIVNVFYDSYRVGTLPKIYILEI